MNYIPTLDQMIDYLSQWNERQDEIDVKHYLVDHILLIQHLIIYEWNYNPDPNNTIQIFSDRNRRDSSGP